MLRMLARLLVVCAASHCAYGYLNIIEVESPQIEFVSPSVLIPSPQILPSLPPPYISSARTTVKTLNYIKQSSNLPLTPTNINFISLMFAIRVMGESVSSGLSFEAAYSTINVIILLGKLMPASARELIVSRYDNELIKIQPVLKLIEDICPYGSADCNCDLKIDRIIKRNPVYKAPATLLVESAKLWEYFNQHKTQILQAASADNVVEYLSKNKYVYKPIIEQDALVLNLERSCIA